MAETSPLVMIIAKIIETRRSETRISPAWVATEAMIVLKAEWMREPDDEGYPLVYLAAHLELRQIAREKLREKFEPAWDEDKDTHPLFPELQWRYPVSRPKGVEPKYVLLEHLTGADVSFNVNRLRVDARSRLAHADALEAWGRDRPRAA
jgi:hypothetical protein